MMDRTKNDNLNLSNCVLVLFCAFIFLKRLKMNCWNFHNLNIILWL
jgi:hypothetical protein